jgi:cytochrome P450
LTTTDAPAINLLDPATFADGHPREVYRWLRENDPVHWHDEPGGPGFWAVTRHADIRYVGRHPALFSSTPSILIPDPVGLSFGDRDLMIHMDPPRHGGFRRLMIPDFVPKAVADLRPRVYALAARIVDAVCARGECDIVEDIAGEMPSFVIADMLGLPLDDGRELYKLTELIHAAPESVAPGAGMGAVLEMFAYANSVYTDRKANPRDDISTRLVQSEVEGRPFDEIDFNLMFLLLVDAGGDTTRNLVAGGIDALFDHPDERARLQADVDGVLPTAIDEMLRWVTPVTYMRRTALEDTELAGRSIAAGQKVVLYYGSANQDDTVFDRPDVFDLSRTPNDHVAFGGGGPHFCLGAHLGRMEIDAILREVLTRLPDLQRAGPTEWLPSTFICGPKHLPVTFSPAARSTG